MSDLGKAIYMACFALMFVVAASTAIYMYGTLSAHLDTATGINGVEKRTESEATDTTIKERLVDRSEIYITLYNMEQMHINRIEFCGDIITKTDVKRNDVDSILYYLDANPSAQYSYRYDPNLKQVSYSREK